MPSEVQIEIENEPSDNGHEITAESDAVSGQSDVEVEIVGQVTSGVSDHGELTGLDDDDHTQYALSDGTRGDFEPSGTAASLVTQLGNEVNDALDEIESELDGKSDVGHNHDADYDAAGTAMTLVGALETRIDDVETRTVAGVSVSGDDYDAEAIAEAIDPYITGGGGSSVHNDLTGRDAANAHPMSSITGLEDTIDDLEAAVADAAVKEIIEIGILMIDTDMSGGDFDDVVSAVDGTSIPRMYLPGMPVLVVSGPDMGLWTITSSGPCTPGVPLVVGQKYVNLYGGFRTIALIDTADGATVAGMNLLATREQLNPILSSINDLNSSVDTLEDLEPIVSGHTDDIADLEASVENIEASNWPKIHGAHGPANMAIFGDGRQYQTDDVGPLDTDGFTLTVRATVFRPDPGRTGDGLLDYQELLTKFADDEWVGDQDAFEFALVTGGGRVGVFYEMVREGDPIPVSAGEWPEGRFYSYDTAPAFHVPFGVWVELRMSVEYDVDGNTRLRYYYRVTSRDDYDLATPGWIDNPSETRYWKLLGENVQPGVIQLAHVPTMWRIGCNNGVRGVEREELYRGIASPELWVHFDARDAQEDGTVVSSQVPGMIWYPNDAQYPPIHIDTYPNDEQVVAGATEEYVDDAVAAEATARDAAIIDALEELLAGAPSALDTLSELAAAINNDASFAASVTTALSGKVSTSRTLAGLDLSADRSAATLRTALSLVIGTNVQAWDADLDAISGLSPSNDDIVQRKAGVWTNRTVAQFKTDLNLTADDIPDGVVNHAFTAADDTKLSGVEAGATANSTDATLLSRANHTGSQAQSTITNLTTDLAGKVSTSLTLAGLDLSSSRSASTLRTALGLVIGTDVMAQISGSDDDVIQRKSGSWTNRTMAQLKTDLAVTKTDVGLSSVTNDAQVKASLGTTKGDTIVYTASGTPARHAVGSDGLVPTSDSNSTDGILQAAPFVSHYFESGQLTALAPYISTTLAMVNNRMYIWPFHVPRRITFDRIGVNHTSGTSTTGVIRLAIYTPSAVGGGPGALLTDFSGGTLNPTTAAAIKLLTISQALDPGNYWAACVWQGTGTAPTIAAATTPGSFIYPDTSGVGAGNVAPLNTAVSGSPPNPAAPNSVSATAAVVYLRMA